jgi:hypothetical protein
MCLNMDVRNGILLCRTHHRAKRRDGWWPTLHPDGTVTWTHPDGRTRTDPHTIDNHITTLINASTAAARAAEDPADLVHATAGDTDMAGSESNAAETARTAATAQSANEKVPAGEPETAPTRAPNRCTRARLPRTRRRPTRP